MNWRAIDGFDLSSENQVTAHLYTSRSLSIHLQKTDSYLGRVQFCLIDTINKYCDVDMFQ